jgi:histidine ammonia-lyase
LSGGSMPYVPSRGQGGAGEILSLSHLFLHAASQWPLAVKDMLALVNGSPAATALVADIALSTQPRLHLALQVFALAAEAFNTPHGHFAAELEQCWNNPHDAWALSQLRDLMTGGDLPRRPYQAPVSIRILPRILGQAHRAASTAEEVARQSLAAVSDNPVVFPPGQQIGVDPVVSTGGYHNMQAAAAMDGLVCAYTNLAVLAGRIAAKLQCVFNAPILRLRRGHELSWLLADGHRWLRRGNAHALNANVIAGFRSGGIWSGRRGVSRFPGVAEA